MQRSDLGPMIKEDAVLKVMMERAGLGGQTPVVVPSEATAALGMVLLREYGVLTVNTHGQPGARVSLRLKPTLDALSRVGGVDLVVRAVMGSLDEVVKIINDRDAMARLILGE